VIAVQEGHAARITHGDGAVEGLLALNVVALRGRRQGAAAPPAPPARDAVPWNPDSRHAHTQHLAHMLTGNPIGRQRADRCGSTLARVARLSGLGDARRRIHPLALLRHSQSWQCARRRRRTSSSRQY
jgi:hypothetical protein